MVNSLIDIDSIKIDVLDTEMTVLNICENAGIQLPRFCYHEGLKIAGNCRMCLVVLVNAIDPVISCSTTFRPNLVIRTRSERVDYIRRSILEFLLLNHPLDCPICDQASECDLQDQSLLYGSSVAFTRSIGFKREVEDVNFGPVMKTIMTRCILCTRCVRFIERESLESSQGFGVVGRGVYSQISTFVKSFHLSNLSGNLIDLCPVGAITNRFLAYEERTWEYKSRESVDIFDSINSFIRVDYMDNQIIRILPKWSSHVLSHFITNDVRFSYLTLNVRRFLLPSCTTLNFNKVRTVVKYSWEIVLYVLSSIFLYSSVSLLIPRYLSFNTFFSFKKLSFLLHDTSISNTTFDFRNAYCFRQSVYLLYNRVEATFLYCDLKNSLPILYLNLGDYLDLTRHYYIGSTPNTSVYFMHVGLSFYTIPFLNLYSSSFNKSTVNSTNVVFYSNFNTSSLKFLEDTLLFPIYNRSESLIGSELSIPVFTRYGSTVFDCKSYLSMAKKIRYTRSSLWVSPFHKLNLYSGMLLLPTFSGAVDKTFLFSWSLAYCIN